MRVGVDARLLSERITGIGRYTAELTKYLVQKPGKFNLYSPSSINSVQWSQDNVRIRSTGLSGRIQRMLWSETYLPLWATKDKVDVFWGTTHRLPSFLPNKTARVVTIHDLVWKHAGETMRPVSRWMETKLMPSAIKQADIIVADSFSTAKDIEEEYTGANDRIRVIYPGVTKLPAPLHYQSLTSLGIVNSYFLFVGTLEPRKNLQRLLQAYASLATKIKNQAQLVIVGGRGWGDIDLTSLIKSLGLIKSVIVVDYINDAQLSTLYAHARFLVMPSLYEGFGLPLIEAMSFGTPVLTSNISSLPEVAGNAGLLIDPKSINSIADGLSTLLCDNEIYSTLQSKTIANAQRFTWKTAAQQMWDVFQEAIQIRSKYQRTSN